MNSDASEQVVMSAIKKLHKPEILSTNAPSCVEFTLFDDKVNSRFILHAVNVSETREILPVHDIEVSLCLTRKINNAYFIPSLKPVKVSDNVGSISFKIDKLEIAEHSVFEY